jgi:putative ABC transport system ATP-binding protein
MNSVCKDPVLVVEGLRQEFKSGRRGENFCVDVPQLQLPRGEFVAIQGPNGCGKTTLVTVLALLRRPSNLRSMGTFSLRLHPNSARASGSHISPGADSLTGQNGGNVEVTEIDLKKMWQHWLGRSKINLLRRRYIGFAPQQLELLPALRVHETVAISLWLNGWRRKERQERVRQLLDQFGLLQAKIVRHRINSISGGQQQKVTLARAIAHRPPLIFLDEPTAYLYHKDAEEALRVLKSLQHEAATKGCPITVVMITHDNSLAKKFATFTITMDVRDKGDHREGYIVNVGS